MSKAVFSVMTTNDMNATYHQAQNVNDWLRQICEGLAREHGSNGRGPTVQVIIEVLDGKA